MITYVMAVEALDEVRIFWRNQVFAVHFFPFIGNSCWPGIGYDDFVIDDLMKVSFHEQVVLVET